MAASEGRWFFSKQSTIGDPKLKPFRQRPKKGIQFNAIIHERSQSRPCHCRPSQVSSGRPSIGKKHVWLIFLTWSYTTWVFPHLHFLLHGLNTLTIAKWGHRESGGIPNGMLRKQGLAGLYFSHLCTSSSVLCNHIHIARKRQLWEEPLAMARPFSCAKIILYFRATLWLLESERELLV